MSFDNSSSSSEGMRNNDLDDNQIHRTWELTKIGNFDEESWLNIFQHLNDLDLANVATVCKTFETLAQKVFKRRHSVSDGKCSFSVYKPLPSLGWTWVPVICRFRNIITDLHFSGPSEGLLYFIDEFVSESSVTRLWLDIYPEEFESFEFRKTFHNLESLAIVGADLGERNFVMTTLNRWCPNLKSLTLSMAKIGNEDFFWQSLQELEELKLFSVSGLSDEYLWKIFYKNKHLKTIMIEGTQLNGDLAELELISLLLIDLETMIWSTNSFDRLPKLRRDFVKLKSLSFIMDLRNTAGIYTNQLLEMGKYLPNIEVLRVIHCFKNSMTNDDLINLIDQYSSTLKELEIISHETETCMKFGYDLHRKIYATGRNRSICIELEFGTVFLKREGTKKFEITKDGIWENGEIIVLASSGKMG